VHLADKLQQKSYFSLCCDYRQPALPADDKKPVSELEEGAAAVDCLH
jgi:hypothetical protein